MRIRYLIILSVGLRVCVVLLCFTFLVVGNYVVGTIWFNTSAPEAEVLQAIEEAPDLNILDDAGYTGLMFAAIYNNPSLAQAMISAGADVNIQSKKQYNNTALHFALMGGDQTIPIAQLYLENYANLFLRNTSMGATPLLVSFFIVDLYKRLAMVQRLIKNGGSINAQFSTDGNTLLHYMVENRDSPFVKMMVDNLGSLIDFDIKNKKGYTAYEWAKLSMYNEIEEMLVVPPEPLVTPGKRDKNGLTALMIWVMRKNVNLVKALINQGADVNAVSDDEYKYTPLILAVLYEHLPLVELLMQKKASVLISDARDKTPLLLQKKTNVLAPDVSDKVPLLTQKKAADVLVPDARGKIPLMHIIRMVFPNQRVAFAQQLLAVKADEQLGHKDNDGNTMLFYVVFADDKKLLQYLISNFKNKIDFSAKNNAMLTAFGLANNLKRYELAKILKPLTL